MRKTKDIAARSMANKVRRDLNKTEQEQVAELENRIRSAESDIKELGNLCISLNDRLTALENK